MFAIIRSIPSGARGFVRQVKREYRARQFADASKRVQADAAKLDAMTPGQRLDAEHEAGKILARAAELLNERK